MPKSFNVLGSMATDLFSEGRRRHFGSFELYISTLEALHRILFAFLSFPSTHKQRPKAIDSNVGEPGTALVAGSGGGARKGQKGEDSGVGNKGNTVVAFVSFLFFFSVTLIPA